MLTSDDRSLLRKVFRAARKKSWTRDPIGPCGRERGSRYWSNDSDTHIELDQYGWLKTPISEVECVTVELAVDVLVAVGVLPVEFSSAFAAGLEEAKTGPVEWGVRVDLPHPVRKEKVGDVIKFGGSAAEQMARNAPSIWAGWTTVRRNVPRPSPWIPVEVAR